MTLLLLMPQLPLVSIWQQISNVASLVMLVVTVVVAAVAALNREQLKTVRESNVDLVQRVGILEASETRLTQQVRQTEAARVADRAQADTEVAGLKQENATLRTVITSAEHLERIEALVVDHQTEAREWWGTLGPHVEAIHQLMERQAGTDDH